MKIQQLFQLSQTPKANGLHLALLNAVLAIFCIINFMGVLFIITSISHLRFTNGGVPSSTCVGLITLQNVGGGNRTIKHTTPSFR